ncbi:MAG TPA: response regulator transcription factor [Pyrinomonadaceae bacterium]|jgi:DNA-binding NarL/FixJ family response regulator|nr:response regulator transcription factor [Pyrinomonadaceae bacterium]
MKSSPPEPDAKQIRVLIIDDHALIRSGLRMLLEARPNMCVVGDVGNASDALSKTAKEKPNIILLDINLGSTNGLDLLPELLTIASEGRILILSGVNDPDVHNRAVLLGASGVVLKDKAAETLIKAIERVHAGEVWLDRTAISRVFAEMAHQSEKKEDPEARKINTLTQREREVIALIGTGLKNKEIARRLFISETTVRHHLTSVFSKLGVSDRLELMIYAYRYGLAEPPR